MRFSKLIAFFAIVAGIFVSLSLASAMDANYSNVTVSIERSASNVINFSIGAMSENITQVQFVFTGSQNVDPDYFETDSNGTDATRAYFSNLSISAGGAGGGHVEVLTFTNTSGAGIIKNGTSQNFWFNMVGRSMSSSLMNITVNITGISSVVNDSNNFGFGFTFRFSGYVKNESGGYQNQTNVTISRFVEGVNGPPTETVVGSALTNSEGAFTLSGLSTASSPSYTLKMIYYNSSGTATKVGSILPPFPAEMYYPKSFSGSYEFMRPPSLNGTTFYIGPAATLNISATNGTNSQLFGYMVMEQGTGFPIVSNSMANLTEVYVVLPINRLYTVMLGRFNSQFANSARCNGQFMNDTGCGTPPKSNSTINPTVAGQKINVQLDMRVNRVRMYGCINAVGNASSIVNVSAILPRMLPWTGFVPPMRPDMQDIDLTDQKQLNYSDYRCAGKLARYNISLLNSNYLVEFYGKNLSSDVSAEWVGAFQNVSFDGQTAGTNNYINITLGQLAGSFVSTSSPVDANRTKFTVRIQNSTGGAITQDKPSVNLYVRNSVFGELTFIIEDFTNGTFTLALPLNSTVKAKVFSSNAPPKEKTVNLSAGELNITLISMTSGDGGFRKINSSGGMEVMNITKTDTGVAMKFIRNSADCNVVSPSSSCTLTSMDANNFNPFSALVAGKINMEMKMKTTNVAITFYNFDMLSAKQPPMESVMNNQASGGSSSAPVWQFGSFVPADVYDYAVVAMPYSDSDINDSATMTISLNTLYDENWGVVWNSSRGDSSANISSSVDDYYGNVNNRSYNSSGYRNLIDGGVTCSKTNSNIALSAPEVYCYVDTTSNLVYMRVPHFSGVAPLVTGSAPASGSSSSSTSSSSSANTNNSLNYWWSTSYTFTDKDFASYNSLSKALAAKERIKVKIDGSEHSVGVIALDGNTTATINISSTPQQIILGIGESKKVEVTGDNYYDILVELISIKNYKANVTITHLHEVMPAVTSTTTTAAEGSANSGTTLTNSSGNSSSDAGFGWLIWTGIIIIAIVIIIIVVLFFLNSRRSFASRVKVLGK